MAFSGRNGEMTNERVMIIDGCLMQSLACVAAVCSGFFQGPPFKGDLYLVARRCCTQKIANLIYKFTMCQFLCATHLGEIQTSPSQAVSGGQEGALN